MAGFNLADIRVSKNEENVVNDNPYIDVAKAYYDSDMYNQSLSVIPDIFDETIPVFNAVPKVVNIASALAVGGTIEPSYGDSQYVENIIDKLALEQEKIFMTRDLILGKSILVEVQSREWDKEGSNYVETGYDDNDFGYTLAYYPSNEYEIVSEGNRILYAKIKGVMLEINDEGTEYDEVEVEKIYIRNEDGSAKSYIKKGEDIDSEVEYPNGVIPLVEITTTYDMKQLFYSIDRHNELESWIRNILFLAGEPILAGLGLDRLASKSAEAMKQDQYKKLKTLMAKSESAKLQLLEIQGTSATVMINKQHSIVESIIKDYPEYSISEVLAGSNVSEETTRIRLTEILSRVSEVSRNMEAGINRVIGIISFYDGKELGRKYIKFGNILNANIRDVLDMVILAFQNNLITKKSAMYQIRDLFIGEDVDIELAEVEKELKQKQQAVVDGAEQIAPVSDNNDNNNSEDKGGINVGDKQGSTNSSNS